MRKFLLLLVIPFAGQIMAQSSSYFGLFPTIDHSADLSKKFSYNVYLFTAIKPYESTINNISDPAKVMYMYGEAGVSYNITKHLTGTASYVYERQRPFDSTYRNEHRLFQQLTLKVPLNKFELKGRLRFDERFIEDRSTGQYNFNHRLRCLFGLKYTFPKDMVYLFGYSEAFFNTTPNASSIYNENWSAAQVGFKFNKWCGLETGLLYVGWLRGNQQEWLNQFYLQITWVAHFDFKKEQSE